MNVEPIFAGVLLMADITLERFVSGMNKLMGFEMSFGNKLFSTASKSAHEWSIASLLRKLFNRL